MLCNNFGCSKKMEVTLMVELNKHGLCWLQNGSVTIQKMNGCGICTSRTRKRTQLSLVSLLIYAANIFKLDDDDSGKPVQTFLSEEEFQLEHCYSYWTFQVKEFTKTNSWVQPERWRVGGWNGTIWKRKKVAKGTNVAQLNILQKKENSDLGCWANCRKTGEAGCQSCKGREGRAKGGPAPRCTCCYHTKKCDHSPTCR